MNKLVLEIKKLYDEGKIDFDDQFTIEEYGMIGIAEDHNIIHYFDDEVKIEYAHYVLTEYAKETENIECIKLVFKQHDYIAQINNQRYREEITFGEYLELTHNVKQLSDEFDYDNLVAVIIDCKRYDIETVEKEELKTNNLINTLKLNFEN